MKDYGASLDLLAKDGRTALQVARDQKQKSTEQKLQQLAKDAKQKPEPQSEPSPIKKAKLSEATEEKSDVFGVWPTPMTGMMSEANAAAIQVRPPQGRFLAVPWLCFARVRVRQMVVARLLALLSPVRALRITHTHAEYDVAR